MLTNDVQKFSNEKSRGMEKTGWTQASNVKMNSELKNQRSTMLMIIGVETGDSYFSHEVSSDPHNESDTLYSVEERS